ncbi:MAG: DNA-processing protein DprA [Thermodesulfobacteriota bacterium]
MEKEIRQWLAFSRVRGLERIPLGGVFERFGSPGEIFSADRASLELVSPAFAKAVREFKAWDWADRELALIQEKGVDVVTFNDPRYPPLLRQIHDPPCLLYARGRFYDGALPAVAIVGTRRPSHYGLKMAESVARDLASFGVVVVSGMARGCDAAAHRGALAGKGFTVAVLGTGVDLCYPRENARLYEEIAEQGLLLSEYPLSTPPVARNFPRRNRIISGLSHGVLVAEAPLRSGSLMTARLALGYDREVFAVPGQALNSKGTGGTSLIKNGAAHLAGAADVMEALSLVYTPPQDEGSGAGPAFAADERVVWKALGADVLHIDAIAERTGFAAPKVSAILLGMELKGLIEQKPGKCFVRNF